MSEQCCRVCAEAKDESEFPWLKQECRPDTRCYDCQNAYARTYQRAARRRRGLAPVTPWTSERIEDLRQIILAGATIGEAAAKTGRTVSSLKGARRNYYLPPFIRPSASKPNPPVPVWTSARIASVARLLARGKSYSQIGVRIGAKRNAVAGAIHRYREEINAFASV